MAFRIKGLWEKRLCEGTSGNVLKHEINKHTKINLPNCSAVQCNPENLQRFPLCGSDNVLVSIHCCDKYSGKQDSQGINVWCGLGFQDSLQAIILGVSGQEAGDTKVIDKKSKEREGIYIYIPLLIGCSQKLSPFLQCSGPPAKRIVPSITGWVCSNQITIKTIPHRHAQRPTC